MSRSSVGAFAAGLLSILAVRTFNPSIHLGGVWSRFLVDAPSQPRRTTSSTHCSNNNHKWKADFLYESTPENLGRGVHYLCVTPSSSSSSASDGVTVIPYIDAVESSPPEPSFDVQDPDELMLHLSRLVAARPDKGRDFKLFDTEGNELFSESQLKKGSPSDVLSVLSSANLVLLFEGGTFIWPGVKLGHRRTVSVGGKNESLTLRTLALRPLLYTVEEQFVSDSECDHVQERSRPHMKQSGVSLMDKDKGKKATEWRTSSTYFLPSRRDAVLEGIDSRVEALTRISKGNQEQIQVLNYGPTQKYDGHHDYFDPAMYANDAHTMRMIDGGRRNRIATVFFYLSDVEGGGETMFFRAHGKRQPTNLSDCSDGNGLKVKPEKGKVIIFYSLNFDGTVDPYSLHGGCPVISGEKWSGNKWL
eukprot:CAMPEP_0182463108 /NCGR_PEP_ID=MMETSP1319-20130603/7146_1 /TAXON_ID=172717 /ORGANISM="Bolidomonas pacifica, Strain RCC208" /LENGTH=417 /DNA_ID=CAMNT_0024662615 /DNA_START=152 /DNA_END=1401 /DNA_ORIENTATION=-